MTDTDTTRSRTLAVAALVSALLIALGTALGLPDLVAVGQSLGILAEPAAVEAPAEPPPETPIGPVQDTEGEGTP